MNLFSLHGAGLIVSLCTGLTGTSPFLCVVTSIGRSVGDKKDMYL